MAEHIWRVAGFIFTYVIVVQLIAWGIVPFEPGMVILSAIAIHSILCMEYRG